MILNKFLELLCSSNNIFCLRIVFQMTLLSSINNHRPQSCSHCVTCLEFIVAFDKILLLSNIRVYTFVIVILVFTSD